MAIVWGVPNFRIFTVISNFHVEMKLRINQAYGIIPMFSCIDAFLCQRF